MLHARSNLGATRCSNITMGQFWAAQAPRVRLLEQCLKSCPSGDGRCGLISELVQMSRTYAGSTLCMNKDAEQRMLATLSLAEAGCQPPKTCPTCKACPTCPAPPPCPTCPACPTCGEPVAPGQALAPTTPASEPEKNWGVNIGWLLAGGVIGVGAYALFRKKKGR